VNTKQEIVARYQELRVEGVPRARAARLLGIPASTLRNWQVEPKLQVVRVDSNALKRRIAKRIREEQR
jgi:hypothetical protein